MHDYSCLECTSFFRHHGVLSLWEIQYIHCHYLYLISPLPYSRPFMKWPDLLIIRNSFIRFWIYWHCHIPVSLLVKEYSVAISFIINKLANVLTSVVELKVRFTDANIVYELTVIYISIRIIMNTKATSNPSIFN